MSLAAMLTQVKAASANAFDAVRELAAEWDGLDACQRHDLAVSVSKLASVQGASVPVHIEKYAGETLSPRFEARMKHRQDFTADEDLRAAYDKLGKIAAALAPEDTVDLLYRLDDGAGLCGRYGGLLPDPYLCVYEKEKEAGWSWNNGGEHVTEDQLNRFASSPNRWDLSKMFDDQLIADFKAHPVKAFKGMPDEVKTIFARMATQSETDNDGGVRA